MSYITTPVFLANDFTDEQFIDITHFVIEGEETECCIIEVVNSEQPLLDNEQQDQEVLSLQENSETSVIELQETTEPLLSQHGILGSSEVFLPPQRNINIFLNPETSDQESYLYQELPENQPCIVMPQLPVIDPEIKAEEIIDNNSNKKTQNVELKILKGKSKLKITQNSKNKSKRCTKTTKFDDKQINIIQNKNKNQTISDISSNLQVCYDASTSKLSQTGSSVVTNTLLEECQVETSQVHTRTRRRAPTNLQQKTIVEPMAIDDDDVQRKNEDLTDTSSSALVDGNIKINYHRPTRLKKAKLHQTCIEKTASTNDDIPSKVLKVLTPKAAKHMDSVVKYKNPYQEVNIYTQMSILEEFDKKKLSKNDIAIKFNIPLSVLCTIISKRDSVEDRCKNQYVNMLDLAPKSNTKNAKPVFDANSSSISTNLYQVQPPLPFNSSEAEIKLCNLALDEAPELVSSVLEVSSNSRVTRKRAARQEIERPDSRIVVNLFPKSKLKMKENTEKGKKRKSTQFKRKALDLATKMLIIDEVDSRELTKKEISEKYNIPFSTLTTILNHREKVEQCFQVKTNHPNQIPVNVNTYKHTTKETSALNKNKKRASIDLYTKIEILKHVDEQELNRKTIAKKFHISSSTVTCLVNNREKIENFSKMNTVAMKKYRSSSHVEIEHKLLEYVSQLKSGTLTNTQLSLKAKSIANNLGVTNFKCHPSCAWIWRFKKTFNIKTQRTSNEERTKVHEALQQWKKVGHTGNLICDLCDQDFQSTSAIEKHLKSQHFPSYL